MTAPPIPPRPALKYFGSKWRLADWIVSHLPPHACYVEPYAGSAAVLLRKRPALFEVYNDADQSVVTFYRVLREQPEALMRAIALTPWSRAERAAAWEPAPAGDDVESARRTYVRFWQSWHGHGHAQSSGWRYMRGAIARSTKNILREWQSLDHLAAIAARLRDVQIECDDARAVIRRFDTPETVFYVDPPYVPSTRSALMGQSGRYTHEMDDAGHAALADVLRNVQGYVVLSGYDSRLYAELYGDWPVRVRQARDQAARVRREVLWLSPRTAAALTQRSLFDEQDGEGTG